MLDGRSTQPKPPLAKLSLAEALSALDGDLTVAGQLLRDDASYRLDTQGGGLHVATVADNGGGPVETELQLTGRKVKDYHCECGRFAEERVCPHVAALMGGVQLARQVRSARRARPPRRSQTASTKRLLDNVDDLALRDFVREYARRHPDFALDLRVRFAEAMPVANRFEPVIKKLLARTGQSYGPSQARRIREALEQFATQRERYLAERSFLDLFELNSVLVARVVVVIGKAERVGTDLAEYVDGCLRELATVARSSPPPVLLERLEAWIGEQLERGAYFRHGLAAAVGELVDALASDDGSRALAVLDAGQQRTGAVDGLAAAKMSLLYRHDRTEEASAILLEHLDDPLLVSRALQMDVAAGRLERAVRLAVAAYEHHDAPADRLRLARFLTAEAGSGTVPELLERFGPEVVIADGAPDVLKRYAESSNDPAPAERAARRTLARLPEARLQPEAAESLRAGLSVFLGEYKAVEDLLYRSTHPTVIGRYLPALVGRIDDDDLALLLDTKIREHLVDRFGRAPAEWTARLLDEVAKRSHGEVASAIVSRIRRDYSQRPALLDALDEVLL